jgi:ribosomal protein S18 acetylase RimI-like enzyme
MMIRPYEPTDESAVIDLWCLCGLTRAWNDPRRDISRKIAIQPEMFLVAIAQATGALVGTVMAGYEGHRGWINYLAVAPEFRRQGIARSLMSEAEKRLHIAGCPKINLQVRASNAEVVAFYRAIGFEVDAVISMGKRLIDDSQ